MGKVVLTVSEESNCPDKCPITNEPLFMEIEHPILGLVPTYGGPYDSYTIPEIDDEGDFCRYRFDHDEGCWVDGVEVVGNATEIIVDLRAKLEEAEKSARYWRLEAAKLSVEQEKKKELERLVKLGQATEKGLKVIVDSIPCKGFYRSDPCKEKNTYTLGCALRYFCELKMKEKGGGYTC